MIITQDIEKWQTLIGSALGPFLAIMLALLGFFIKGKFQKRWDRKEAIRSAEIAFSQTYNHTVISVDQLEYFIERIKGLINEIKKITEPNQYANYETNYPPIINIQFNEELLKMKFGSYYLHNKILSIEYFVRNANSTISQFRIDFEKLLKKNEWMIEKQKPEDQRQAYIQHLQSYIHMFEMFLESLKKESVKSILKAKVYNLKLMKGHSMTIRKYESKKDMSLEAVDRIDDSLQLDTNKLLEKVRARASKI